MNKTPKMLGLEVRNVQYKGMKKVIKSFFFYSNTITSW